MSKKSMFKATNPDKPERRRKIDLVRHHQIDGNDQQGSEHHEQRSLSDPVGQQAEETG